MQEGRWLEIENSLIWSDFQIVSNSREGLNVFNLITTTKKNSAHFAVPCLLILMKSAQLTLAQKVKRMYKTLLKTHFGHIWTLLFGSRLWLSQEATSYWSPNQFVRQRKSFVMLNTSTHSQTHTRTYTQRAGNSQRTGLDWGLKESSLQKNNGEY